MELSLFVEELFSSGMALEIFQFIPQGTSNLFLSHGNPELIWEGTVDKLACAVGSFQGLLCKAIHLDVDAFL
jgi:hypothetical protein